MTTQTAHNGGGNPNHDPNTGRFTSGPQGRDDGEIIVNGRRPNSSSTPGPHWTTKSASVEVPDLIRDQVDDVAKDYHAATGKDLVVTDGPRTPQDQAERMYYKYAHGDFKTYKGWFAAQIAKAYRDGVVENKEPSAIKADMADLISQYMKQAHPISYHLVNRAVDFSNHGMSNKDRDALTDAIRKHGGRVANEGIPQHTHATFERR